MKIELDYNTGIFLTHAVWVLGLCGAFTILIGLKILAMAGVFG